ncbi:hypothetical protein FACS1894174_08930 [Bacteroidia bacterium]|nr:hypothetical protein FACS1894174_08930 [Bacteroidia bacterium]
MQILNFIRKKIIKSQQKRTFQEYYYSIVTFQIDENSIGNIDYARWLHPFDTPKSITNENIRFYKNFVSQGDMVIDIGAHEGDTSVPMALAVGKDGLVLALEPNKYVYKVLEKNASLNKEHTNIVPLCFAATAEDGEFTFNYSDASFCNGGFLSQINNKKHGHNYTLNVKGVNLEHYLLDNYKKDLTRLKLIKIDAEGYDAEILKSISKIIIDFKPKLIIECYKRLTFEERNKLYDLIDEFGYDLFYLENFEKNFEMKKIGKENMMDYRHFDMLAVHRSLHHRN